MREMIEKLIANRRGHALAFVLFMLFMVEEYVRFVYGKYYSAGFDYRTDCVTIVVGVFLLGLMAIRLFAVPPKSDFSYAISIFVAMFFAVPTTILYMVGGGSVWVPLYALVFVYLIGSNALELPTIATPRVGYKHQRWLLPVITLLMIVPFVVAYRLNINFEAFGMGKDIYEMRTQANAHGNIFTAYLLGPLTKVMLPLLIVYGIKKRNVVFLVGGIVGMLYLFLANPHKSVFFSIFVVLIFYFFKNHKAKAGLILYGGLALVLLSAAVNLVSENLLVESIAVRRMFFIPAQVASNYFGFFDESPLMLSHSFLSSINDYPYDVEPAYLMGLMMYNRTITHCNTGIIADGFMNFGHIGALLYMVIAAMVVKFFDALKVEGIFFGMVLLLVMTFLNSALFTTLLTHGGILLMLVAMFFMAKRTDQ